MAFFLLQLSKRGKTDQQKYRRRIAEVWQTLNSYCLHLAVVTNIFWKKNPALFYGISFLLGCAARISFNFSYVVILLAVGLSTLLAKETRRVFFFRFFYAAIFSLFAYLFTSYLYQNTSILTEKTEVAGYFSINSLSPYATPFKKGYAYKGTFHYLSSDSSLKEIPCSLYWYLTNERPKANQDYLLKGTLFPTENGAILRPYLGQKWIPCSSTFSLAEWRFQCKERIRSFFHRNIKSQESASFLSALVTGDLFDRSLKYSFQQLGLSHLLVISGFHFAFLTAFAAFLLRLFLPFSKVLWLLFLIVNGYFLFLGNTPSVQRAWIVIQLYLLAKILGKKTTGTQLLGFALLVELILNPLMAKNIGFQLSFLSCLGILLLFSPIDAFFSRFLRKRSLEEVKELTPSSQFAFIFSSFFRKAFSLSLAVNAALLPVLLWHFHKFPLLGLPYNLFFPFLVMIDMALMVVSLILFPLFPFSLKALEWITSFLLTLTSNPPATLQYSLHCKSFPFYWLIIYLGLLFLAAIGFSKNAETTES